LILFFVWSLDPLNPVNAAGSVAVLLTTGLVAAWFPTRRAARVDPAAILRAE